MPVGNRRTERVTLIGASARAAAESARRAGLEVVAFDLFGDDDTRAACRWRPLRTVAAHLDEVATSDCLLLGGTESRPRLHRLLRLAGAGPPLRFPWYRDGCTWAYQMEQVVSGSTVRWPETRHHPPTNRRGWLCKRIDSAGGVSVTPADHRRALRKGHWIWQREIPGEPLSAALLLTEKDIQWLGSARSLPPAPETGVSRYCYGGSLRQQLPPPLLVRGSLQIGQRLRRQYGVSGLVGLDFIAQPDALFLLEINARYTASMELHEPRDGSLIGAHCDAIHGLPFEVSGAPELRGKKIVYAVDDMVAGDALAAAMARLTGADVQGGGVAISVHDRPPRGTKIRRRTPLCTLLGRGSGEEEIAHALQQAEQRLLREADSAPDRWSAVPAYPLP